jgi:hypothetical protein
MLPRRKLPLLLALRLRGMPVLPMLSASLT